MKKQFLSFIILLSLVVSAVAQKAQPQTSNASDKNLRTHVEYLASAKLEGRRTGETGATFAAGYVANKFANYKLKAGFSQTAASGKTKANYLQTFPFVTGVEKADGNSFNLEATKTGNERLTFSSEADFKPIAFSPNAEIGKTEVVFIGYGIASSELKHDDYKAASINGRIVAAFDGTPEADSPHSAWSRFDALAKARIAKEKGAIGLLLISRQLNFADDKLAQMIYDPTMGEAALPTLLVSRKIGAGILGTDEARLKSAEERLATLAKSATGEITSELAGKPRVVASFKVNFVKNLTDAYNVVGILEGTDAQLKNEAIVIGAHYDHLGRGGQGSLAVNSKEIHYGADDNASGVAAMLEIARRFSQEKRNKRTLVFVAFGGEEQGLFGSKFYVSNPAFPINRTVAMINLDMVGRLKDDKLTVGGIGTASEWKSLIENKNLQQINAPSLVKLTNVPETNEDVSITKTNSPFQLALNEDGFGPSDHSSFYAQKIPVLFFFTGTHLDYHKPTDTAEKINYAGLLKITDYIGEIVRSVDASLQKPTYAVAKSSGIMGGRTGFSISLGTVPSYSESTDGMTLDAVRDASPAQQSGLKAGDKIIKLAGREIRNVADYTFVLGEMKAGIEYEVVVKRGAEQLTLKIVPAARK